MNMDVWLKGHSGDEVRVDRKICKFKQIAEKFLAEHGLKDYFRKAFIHSNNRDIQEYVVLETDKYKKLEKENFMNIALDATQQKELKKRLKCGIYKELHKRNILSDAQLNSLLERD